MHKLPIIHQAYKVSRFIKTIKFGVEVLHSTKKAFEMDQVEGNNLWRESMQIEIDQLHAHETFIALEEHQNIPSVYKRIPYHCIYDVKYDGRRRYRLVAQGHMTDPPNRSCSQGSQYGISQDMLQLSQVE